MMGTMGDALIGTWTLAACTIDDAAGAVLSAPLGERPEGRLTYTPDGQVSVHAMAAGRPRCNANRIQDSAPAEQIAAAQTYFGYAGTWERAGDRVTHHVTVSSFPNWTGTDLVRDVALNDDTLVLSSPAAHADPRAATVVLTWKRDRPRGE